MKYVNHYIYPLMVCKLVILRHVKHVKQAYRDKDRHKIDTREAAITLVAV